MPRAAVFAVIRGRVSPEDRTGPVTVATGSKIGYCGAEMPTVNRETMQNSVGCAAPGSRMVSDDRFPAHGSGSDSHSTVAVISGEGSQS